MSADPTIETGLAALIAGIPAVAAITTQIWWNVAPQRVLPPYIVLSQISGTEEIAHDGPIGVGDMRLQVDCHAPTAGQAKALRLAIVRAINGTAPVLTDGTQVDVIEHVNSLDRTAPEAFADDVRFCAVADFLIQYQT